MQPADPDADRDADTAQARRALRLVAEAAWAAATQAEAAALGPQSASSELLHELQVHKIELEMQNGALREAKRAMEASRDRFAELYEFAPVGYLLLGENELIEEANLSAVKLLGQERRLLLGRSFIAWVAPAQQVAWRGLCLRLRRAGEGQEFERREQIELLLQRRDGSQFLAHLECGQRPREGPQARAGLAVLISDVSALRASEARLRLSDAALGAITEGVHITDPDGRLCSVNAGFEAITGYSAAEAIGRKPSFLQGPDSDPKTIAEIRRSLRERRQFIGEILNYRKDGKAFWSELTISPLLDAQGQLTHFVGVSRDISERKRSAAEIQHLAFHDALTQLPNRRLLQLHMEQALAASVDSGQYSALFFLDLDKFKELNDSRGHDMGDLLLVGVAQRLREALRKQDTVSRQGGDEFVLLVRDLGSNQAQAAKAAGLIGSSLPGLLAPPFDLEGFKYHCKASIGAALFRAPDTVAELLKHADLALYEAKSAGRDRLRFFDPAMQLAQDQRMVLETELRLATELGQWRLYYQPQVDAGRRMVGVEALLRWQHPRLGLLLPDDFIGLAEDSGLILPIGLWVLQTACAQLKSWEADPRTAGLQMAVNVSAMQFRQIDFVAQIKALLAVSACRPERLKLELTESLALDDIGDTIDTMLALKGLGLHFSMDDFGTGHASLNYLAQLPLDQLKIDKSFVAKLPGLAKDETIARAIITMGLGLNMSVIAEGVETEAQRDFLGTQGCDECQGFLFSRPLPIDALQDYLDEEAEPEPTA
ncbi:putative bifunctional diguanylate cyclase/phosphodiesterase [Roseateles oligotrophus]|uniref:EAL domain-containing protein n=1 Tax=Roseateles oligotrophus TaxID=1769250 RepID=A0ABT2YFT7_9BURK|nr:bifunctional diguanylate cyclase/phosphodiesterase [Roseateles oligotrophus]MCV2368921.1 EAL domain-containing protein [Roseateles oligotrophus]